MNKINTICVILLLLSTIAITLLCKNNNKNEKKYERYIDITTNNKSTRKWVEYKKIYPFSIQDTIPYHNCYIIIENDKFFYYKEGKMEEYRTMIRDTLYHYETYRFKEKEDDILQFYNNDQDTVVLFRDNYDGISEYFKYDKHKHSP